MTCKTIPSTCFNRISPKQFVLFRIPERIKRNLPITTQRRNNNVKAEFVNVLYIMKYSKRQDLDIYEFYDYKHFGFIMMNSRIEKATQN